MRGAVYTDTGPAMVIGPRTASRGPSESAVRIVYIEPFEAGSHARFGRTLTARISADWHRLTLPGRHWKWRMRGSGVFFAHHGAAAFDPPPDLIVASSYLPLTDLLALRPALAAVPRILYFHENQLAFPLRGAPAERDNHFGFTQLVAARAATLCVFNSRHNRDSFLDAGARLLARLPDAVPPGWIDDIAARSRVLGVPLELPGLYDAEDATGYDIGAWNDDSNGIYSSENESNAGPLILWNHRWEYDKAPEAFFEALFRLADRGVPFRVAVCGQRFRKAPPIFEAARARLADRVEHWGYLPDRAAYHRLLARCDLALSTAVHEFFGISMLEAAWFGARPLVPDRLSYPEIFPADYRYADGALDETLRALCARHAAGSSLRADRRHLVRPYGSPLIEAYRALFAELTASAEP